MTSHRTPAVIGFAGKLSRIDTPWSPRVVAELNDVQFKLVKIQGDFIWHKHDDTDDAGGERTAPNDVWI